LQGDFSDRFQQPTRRTPMFYKTTKCNLYLIRKRHLCERTSEYIASKIIELEITYVGNEGKKRLAKKEKAEYLTMGETWRCYIT